MQTPMINKELALLQKLYDETKDILTAMEFHPKLTQSESLNIPNDIQDDLDNIVEKFEQLQKKISRRVKYLTLDSEGN